MIADIPESMSHREKVAWLSLGAMLVTFGPYLVWVGVRPPAQPLPDLPSLALFAAVAACQVLILTIGRLWLRVRSPEEASAPADERDRAISHRSVATAYYVLIAGVILVGCVMPFTKNGWELVNGAIAAIVLAQVVHYGVAIWAYRRG